MLCIIGPKNSVFPVAVRCGPSVFIGPQPLDCSQNFTKTTFASSP